MTQKPDNRFTNIGYEDFRRMAQDTSLNQYEKIGFPTSYRSGHEQHIFDDILSKLTNLSHPRQTVLDIGCGCSELPHLLIQHCQEHDHQLILIDSQEMLDLLPDAPFITKIAGYYPRDCETLFEEFSKQVNVILTYSVIQYVFVESSIFSFVDRSLSLLADGGQMLIGDIPNLSMRNRFFSSETGRQFHRNYTQSDTPPPVDTDITGQLAIDDAVILALLSRYRTAGYHAYVQPQRSDLPFANRREDILLHKP